MAKLTAKITDITPIELVGEKQHPKRLIIVEELDGGQYPQTAALELFGDKVDKFTSNIGDQGEFEFNINARESNGRWYTSLKLWRWKVESLADTAPDRF